MTCQFLADINLLWYSFEVVAKAIYLLNFILDRLRAQLQHGLFQGCKAIMKMTQLRLRSSSFHEHGSSSGAFGFHECGFGFRSFSHINILIVLVFLKFSGKWIKSSTQN